MLFLQNYFNRDSKFQISRYVLPVLGFYLLPVLLFQLNLLPIPKMPRKGGSTHLNETSNIMTVTHCKPKNIQNLESTGNCTNGADCSLTNKDYLTCPPSWDRTELKYCCEFSEKERTWTECCDALTYGIRQHTTSNITFIYFIILSQVLALICCPCSPLFRQFRQAIFQRVCGRTKK